MVGNLAVPLLPLCFLRLCVYVPPCKLFYPVYRRDKATRCYSGSEVTSGHTFLGFVIISQPEAQGLHKNESSSQSLGALAELYPLLTVFSDPHKAVPIKHHTVSLGSLTPVMLFSFSNISQTTGA